MYGIRCFNMELKIRQAREEDLKECADIVLEEFNKQGEGFAPETAMCRVRYLFESDPDLCFCMEIEGKIIGILFGQRFNYAKGIYMWVGEFVIKEEYQGKGYGKAALKFTEKSVKEKGIAFLSLNSRENGNAIKLYEKFGFERTGYIHLEKEIK